MDNFDPYNVLLAIAANILVLLMTAFVLQGHIWLIDAEWIRGWILRSFECILILSGIDSELIF